MSEPVVYVNGQEAGRWNYGYNAFRLDITQLLRRENNEITVRLHNVEESSRWYPGAGLYRPVRLIFTGDIRIDPWETFFRTLSADANNANVSVNTQIKGAKSTKNIKTTVTIKNADGRVVAQKTASPDAQGRASFNLDVAHPQLWSPESPTLYTLITTVKDGNKHLDRTSQRVGIRTIDVSRAHGFRLNGLSRKFQGVCLHHDLGPLGAAVNKSAIIRQIRLMKDMA